MENVKSIKVNKEMDCGWEKIYKKLNKFGIIETQNEYIKIRNFLRERVEKTK